MTNVKKMPNKELQDVKIQALSEDEKLGKVLSTEQKRDNIESQLKEAIERREEYTRVIFKCQGALELLATMESDNNITENDND